MLNNSDHSDIKEMEPETSGFLEKEEIDILRQMAEVVHWPSNFKFLKIHNGIRPGRIHTILGTTGGGKSTLIRSIMMDLLLSLNNGKIVLWLSEESRNDFLVEFSRIGLSEKYLKSLEVFSEQDFSKETRNAKSTISLFREKCKDARVVILDNFTTSSMYRRGNPSEQDDVAEFYKNFAKETNTALILVAHTGSKIGGNYSQLIDSNDIRGSRGIVNISEFFYILQSFRVGEKIFPTIRITKHRGQEASHQLYKLTYHKAARAYVEDTPLYFNEFKQLFKQRNKL